MFEFLFSTTNEVIDTPQKAVYEIYSASPNDEGSYTCHANNAAGIVEERVYIRVEDSEVYPPCRGDVPCPVCSFLIIRD